MTESEFQKQCPLFPSFPNYTQAMYEGDEPAGKGHKHINGGYCERWASKYGGGESYAGEIIDANFSINTKTTIYIVGSHLWIVEQRYSGKSDVWEYTNDGYMKVILLHPLRIHEMETDKIEKILNTKIDCLFWTMVQKRAKQLYNSKG